MNWNQTIKNVFAPISSALVTKLCFRTDVHSNSIKKLVFIHGTYKIIYPTTAKINEKLVLLSKVIHVVKSYGICSSKTFIFSTPALLPKAKKENINPVSSLSAFFVPHRYNFVKTHTHTHITRTLLVSVDQIIIYQYLCHATTFIWR